MSLMNASGLPEARAAAFASLALLGCGLIFLADVLRELARPVKPTLHHSAEAAPVARAAVRAGAAEPWRSSFAFLGRRLSAHAQTCAYGLSWRAPRVAFAVDAWTTDDGGTLSLAWPTTSVEDPAGVAVVLPGLGGDARGQGHAVDACARAGLACCVFQRRGDGQPLTSPRFNLFGDTRDLDEAVERARRRFGGNLPVVLYATSAGTGCLVRYLGEKGATARVAAAFCNSPGYDIAVALTRCGAPYDSHYYLAGVKRHYLGANGAMLAARDADALAACDKATSLHGFLAAAAPFAGAATFGEYLLRSNPIGTAHDIRVPILILNADDDPICSSKNVDDHIALFRTHPTAVLARMPRGGHCGFYAGPPWRAEPRGHALGARFLAAVLAGDGDDGP